MRTRLLTGATVLAAMVLIGHGVLAQGLPELDRALAKADPAAELVADFNELVSATTNIAPTSAAPDQDKAKIAEVRAALQDPNGVAMARDSAHRAAADAAATQITQLAAALEQNVGDRLSADAKAGLARDFKTVAQYMQIVRPGDAWFCQIYGIRVLLPC
ncbi:hypothetical protein [Dongia sedimenti]|uniref:Uncharacterized protein n=1 Tax=Dongia sedimenti TaxID=3064282 RepID=A0ABU0YQS3_9PROT|nr:hypothetical protein [Rhodospirillaceae bacterium R-7]